MIVISALELSLSLETLKEVSHYATALNVCTEQ